MKDKLIEVANSLQELAANYVEVAEVQAIASPLGWRDFLFRCGERYDLHFTTEDSPHKIAKELAKRLDRMEMENDELYRTNDYLQGELRNTRNLMIQEPITLRGAADQVVQPRIWNTTFDPALMQNTRVLDLEANTNPFLTGRNEAPIEFVTDELTQLEEDIEDEEDNDDN